ncbi:MAG: hypothetical protein PHY64_12500, partial [Eubacteriales bacterium]|nr:hypothetical protein [Eubacteriales bacterium]
ASAFGSDSRMALTSSMEAPTSGLIADSEERDHGECAYYPVVALVGDTGIAADTQMLLWHAYTWLWFMAGISALWLIVRRLGLSRLLSSVTALFLALSPRMFAQGHYNNKDIILLSLTLLTLWLALRLMENPGLLRALLFSLAGAAATNTKIIGLYIWGLCALFVLIWQVCHHKMTARVWGIALVTLLSYVGFYALLTPALWADPQGYVLYTLGNAASFSRWQNYVLFRGVRYHLKTTSLPRYYLPYMMLVTTPMWILALIAAGQLLAVDRFRREKARLFDNADSAALLLCTLLWLGPFLYVVLGHPTMYNGWRHFYFLYGPLLVLAAYGVHRIGQKLSALPSRLPARIGAGLLALCMAFTGGQMVLTHPYQYAYYNVLISGRDLPEYLELDYWNVSVLQTLRSLLARLDSEQAVTIAGAELWSQIGLEQNWKLLSLEEQARLVVLSDASQAEYLLSNRTYAALNDGWQLTINMQPIIEIQSLGTPLCTVYAQTVKGADGT